MEAVFGFAFLAGLVSILSPCVLPIVPLVLGAAVSHHRFGPVALAGGLALSFTTVGLFVATVGYALNIEASVFRMAAAIVMIAVGGVMIVPAFQARFATAAGPVGNWADERLGGFSKAGLLGQFGVGLLLGIVWAPCVGPTLGAASLMAARGENLGQVAVAMLLFGLGAALPLLVLGTLSRHTIVRMRGTLFVAGRQAKLAMGVMLMVFGVFILSGMDKSVEARLVDASPAWLTAVSTRF